MRSLGWAVLPLVLLASCGIQTIEFVPTPPVADYSAQTDFTKLSFTHSASHYTPAPDFQGYEIYYRIYYPQTGPFDNLANDASQLVTTPTRDYLVLLGYQALNNRYKQNGNSQAGAVPLVDSPPDGATVTLDFSSFLTYMNNPVNTTDDHSDPQVQSHQPTIKIGGGTPFGVFRSITTSGTSSYPWFSDLYLPDLGSFIFNSDMKSNDPGAVSQTNLTINAIEEVDVFIVAYAFSPDQGTIYSRPVPWGVIGSPNYLKVIR